MEWQQWCKLCANREIDECMSEFESFTDFGSILKKHFSLTITESVPIENHICSKCKEFLLQVDLFSERCMKVNAMLEMILTSDELLQNDAIYLQGLRDNVGLDKDEKPKQAEQITKMEKSTGTDDLIVEEKYEIINVKPRAKRVKKKTKVRKKAEKPDQNSNIKAAEEEEEEDELELDTLDFDTDDFENDPTFSMNSDVKLFEEHVEYNPIGDTELINLNISPRKKRRKPQAADDKNVDCPLCNLNFDNKRQFDTHMREFHPKTENPFACPKCPKQFPSLNKLKRHESVHLPDHLKLVHPCQFCDKRFSKLVNVQAHIRAIHTGERSFICEECGKSFVAKGALKEHQITHSNEYPFQCAHCPKKFKNTARLRTHEDIHKHTAYICPHCGLQLNTKRTLKMHMVVHSDQKKYKCQYCGNEYKRSKALKNHLILHTGLRPYVCPFCEKTFANGSNCRSHKKKAHPVELAALEASGEVLPAANIPKLEHLQPKKPPISESNIVIITQADDKIIENIVYTT